ncbi:MAG: TRAP transporter small permease [Rhodovibrionaceae bacterium]
MLQVEQFIRFLSRALALVAGVCLVLMMVHVVSDVAAKYLFNNPIESTLEIVSAYYMVAVVFLPLSIAEIRREHIYVDMFVRHLSLKPRIVVYVATGILTAFFYGLLAYETGDEAVHAYKINEIMMGTSYVVVWPGRWFLPIGFGAIALANLLHIAQAMLQPQRFAEAVIAQDVSSVD